MIMTKPPILVLILILILHAEAAKMAKKCPDCGTQSIPYPLSTGSDCGDKRYNKIMCENNATLLFRSANNTYHVTSISPSTRSLVIAPSGFTPSTCASQDFPTNGLQLDPTAPFAITRNNTVFFLNCTDSILQAPINCSPGNLCHVYANNATDGAKACSNSSTICCYYNPTGARSSFQMIRLRKEGCMAYTSFVNLDPSLDVQDWPPPGVQLSWANPAGQ